MTADLWFVGNLALYAAIGLVVAALAVLLAFLFELLVAPRRGVYPSSAVERGRAAS